MHDSKPNCHNSLKHVISIAGPHLLALSRLAEQFYFGSYSNHQICSRVLPSIKKHDGSTNFHEKGDSDFRARSTSYTESNEGYVSIENIPHNEKEATITIKSEKWTGFDKDSKEARMEVEYTA